ncbi:hypothetical protein TNCV_2596531 [Trichonephila clavipes]|nr:hypothetical protein TNCV_2596531 [Trichonephila clavipes]
MLINVHFKATRGLLMTDLVIQNHGHGTRTTPDLAPYSPNYLTMTMQGLLATSLTPLHSGCSTGLELMTRRSQVRDHNHKAATTGLTFR